MHLDLAAFRQSLTSLTVKRQPSKPITTHPVIFFLLNSSYQLGKRANIEETEFICSKYVGMNPHCSIVTALQYSIQSYTRSNMTTKLHPINRAETYEAFMFSFSIFEEVTSLNSKGCKVYMFNLQCSQIPRIQLNVIYQKLFIDPKIDYPIT